MEFLTFCIELPTFSEDVFDAFHICEELSFDLAGPDDGSCYWGEVAHLSHVVSFGEAVLGFELVVK